MSYRKYLLGSQKRKLAEERSQKRKLAEERRGSKDIAQKETMLKFFCVTNTKTLKLHENRFSR